MDPRETTEGAVALIMSSHFGHGTELLGILSVYILTSRMLYALETFCSHFPMILGSNQD